MYCVGGRPVAFGGYTIAQYGTMRRTATEQRVMCEVEWADSWLERKVEISVGRKTWKVFTK
jgi:hypothetical protein